MPKITLDNKTFDVQTNETVLQTLLRNNVSIAYGCQQGVCQACLTKSVNASPPTHAQLALKDSLKQQNYFLACLCKPENDLTITLSNPKNQQIQTRIITKRFLSDSVILLELELAESFEFFAGQFVNVFHPDGTTRSYSIASPSHQKNKLAFHIRILPTGKFSQWLKNTVLVGDTLFISNAQGGCHYIHNSQKPLLLIGTGTGLAPLYGIIQDALFQRHYREIYLYHGGRRQTELYLEDELKQLEKNYLNFRYVPCLSRVDAEFYRKGRANDVAFADFPKLNDWQIYLCGNPEMVNQSKRTAYLKGASLYDIYSDAFIY